VIALLSNNAPKKNSAFPTPAIFATTMEGSVACRQGSRSQIWNGVGGGGNLLTTEGGRNKRGPVCSSLGNCEIKSRFEVHLWHLYSIYFMTFCSLCNWEKTFLTVIIIKIFNRVANAKKLFAMVDYRWKKANWYTCNMCLQKYVEHTICYSIII